MEILSHCRATIDPVLVPPDVDSDGEDEDSDEDDDRDESESQMRSYLRCLYEHLKYEVTGSGKNLPRDEKWLLGHLKANNWWLPAVHASHLCNKLGIEFGEPAYFRDVYVWLPDIRWGEEPYCPCCRKNTRTGFHAWRDNHIGRRVYGMKGHYFILSRRYVCHDCKERLIQQRKDLCRQLADSGVTVKKVNCDDGEQYTFMPWDRDSVPLLSFGRGDEFPAILTYKQGLDKDVIDWMVPLFMQNVRPEAFSRLLREQYTKNHTKLWRKRENVIKQKRVGGGFVQRRKCEEEMFSTFGGKEFEGRVPSAEYLNRVFEQYQKSLRPYRQKELKKRSAERIHVDVSYKESKVLCRYRGEVCIC